MPGAPPGQQTAAGAARAAGPPAASCCRWLSRRRLVPLNLRLELRVQLTASRSEAAWLAFWSAEKLFRVSDKLRRRDQIPAVFFQVSGGGVPPPIVVCVLCACDLLIVEFMASEGWVPSF